MIRINRSGLSDVERASVRRPLAGNNDGKQDIDSLGENLAVVMDKYGHIFSEAIDRINDVPTNSK